MPLLPVFHAAPGTAYFNDSSFADDIGPNIPLVLQNPQNGGAAPYPMSSGNIVGVVAMGRLVLARGRDAPAKQFPGNLGGTGAAGGKFKDELHNGSGIRVRLHSAVSALAVAIGTDFKVMAAEMLDNHQISAQYTGKNPLVYQILDMHSTNLLPSAEE